MEDYKLYNNEEDHRYEFHIEEYIPAISYIKTANNAVYLTHTEVPEELEGQGIGSRLVEETLKDIEANDCEVVPMCSFVASYIRRHPQWKRLILEGFGV